MSFFDQDETLISASADQTVRTWDTRSGKETTRLIGSRHEIWSIRALPKQSLMVTGGKDGAVMLWDSSAPSQRRDHQALPVAIMDWNLRPDGTALLTLDRDGKIEEWDAPRFDRGTPLLEIAPKPEFASISAGGNMLAVYRGRSGLEIWSIAERRVIVRPTIRTVAPTGLSFWRNDSTLGILSSNTIETVTTASWMSGGLFEIEPGFQSISISRSGKWVIAAYSAEGGAYGPRIFLRNLETGRSFSSHIASGPSFPGMNKRLVSQWSLGWCAY